MVVFSLSAMGCGARQPPLPQAPRAAVVQPPRPEPAAAVGAAGSGAIPVLARPPDPAAEAPALMVASGEATYYADRFEGQRTASGLIFSNRAAYAAHRTWPFGTVVRVVNEGNGHEVVLTVVDRGPHGSAHTIIDVSRSAAEALGFVRQGRAPVRVEVLEWGSGS
jgi:rare lipoprotein A